jgi:hypothetical protein
MSYTTASTKPKANSSTMKYPTSIWKLRRLQEIPAHTQNLPSAPCTGARFKRLAYSQRR